MLRFVWSKATKAPFLTSWASNDYKSNVSCQCTGTAKSWEVVPSKAGFVPTFSRTYERSTLGNPVFSQTTCSFSTVPDRLNRDFETPLLPLTVLRSYRSLLSDALGQVNAAAEEVERIATHALTLSVRYKEQSSQRAPEVDSSLKTAHSDESSQGAMGLAQLQSETSEDEAAECSESRSSSSTSMNTSESRFEDTSGSSSSNRSSDDRNGSRSDTDRSYSAIGDSSSSSSSSHTAASTNIDSRRNDSRNLSSIFKSEGMQSLVTPSSTSGRGLGPFSGNLTPRSPTGADGFISEGIHFPDFPLGSTGRGLRDNASSFESSYPMGAEGLRSEGIQSEVSVATEVLGSLDSGRSFSEEHVAAAGEGDRERTDVESDRPKDSLRLASGERGVMGNFVRSILKNNKEVQAEWTTDHESQQFERDSGHISGLTLHYEAASRDVSLHQLADLMARIVGRIYTCGARVHEAYTETSSLSAAPAPDNVAETEVLLEILLSLQRMAVAQEELVGLLATMREAAEQLGRMYEEALMEQEKQQFAGIKCDVEMQKNLR